MDYKEKILNIGIQSLSTNIADIPTDKILEQFEQILVKK